MIQHQRGAHLIAGSGLSQYLYPIALLAVLLSLVVVALPPQAIQADGIRAASVATSLDAYITGLSGSNQFSGAVLVAKHGTILLSKGYGMADQALHIPNTPSTKYPVGGVSSNMSLVGALWLEDHGKLPDQALICHYIAACPAAWKPITIHMVLDGTANIPGINWPGMTGTTAHTLQLLQAEQLDGTPGSRFDFQNGDTLVLATIIEKVTGEPWATFLQQTIYGPAGMRRSGRMTDASVPPGWAQDYSGPTTDSIHSYNNFFVVSSTAADVYAYDNALFGGHLLSQKMLTRMFTPLAATFADNSSYIQGLTDEKTCYQAWTSGRAFGHAVLLTSNGARSFQTINMRFPHDQATIVAISNNGNDVAAIAQHLAMLLFGHAQAASPTAMSNAPLRVITPARAVLATYHNTGGGWPFALTPGALWVPSTSADGDYSLLRVDTKTGRLVATIAVSAQTNSVGQNAAVVVNGDLWTIDHAAKAVVRIDPATNKVVTTVPIGMVADQLAVSGTTLWASSGDPTIAPDQVVRVDLRTRKMVGVLTNVGHPADTIATTDAFWYISQDTLRVMRVDAATNKIVASISVGSVPQVVFVGAGSLWVGDASGALVTRIDPRTNKAIATITTEGYPGNRQPRIDDCACVYTVSDGSVWAIANSTTLVRIDPQTNHVVASLTLADRLGSIALSEGSIWISSDGANPTPALYRIDPQAMGAPPLATGGTSSAATALLGTYRRTFHNADRLASHDPGLTNWVGGTSTISIDKRAIHFIVPDGGIADEYYQATVDGRLTMTGYLPENQNSFCSDDPHLNPPPGHYRWARQGTSLIITRVGFDPCLDRGALLPGTWTKIG